MSVYPTHYCPDCGTELLKESRMGGYACVNPDPDCLVIRVRYERGGGKDRISRIYRAGEARCLGTNLRGKTLGML